MGKVETMVLIMLSAARFLRLGTQTSVLVAALWLSSCRTPPPPAPPPTEAPKKPTSLFEWNGGNKGISHVVINVDEQKAYLYKGKSQVGWSYVATGIPNFPTPTGKFKVMEKIQDKVSTLYGKSYGADGKIANSDFKIGRDLIPAGGRFEAAKMPYFMRLTGDGVGMHIGQIPRPGHRASHGCVRMPAAVAPIVYANIAVGTPVEIIGTGPDYPTYLKQAAKKAQENSEKLAAATKKAQEKVAAAGGAVTPSGAPTTTPAVPAPTSAPEPTPAPGSSTITTAPVAPAPAAPKPQFLPPSEEIKPAIPVTKGQN